MFDMGVETMNMPMSEKMKFEQGDDGMSFGCVSSHALLSDGTLLRGEM